jgi:hypothetical protein
MSDFHASAQSQYGDLVRERHKIKSLIERGQQTNGDLSRLKSLEEEMSLRKFSIEVFVNDEFKREAGRWRSAEECQDAMKKEGLISEVDSQGRSFRYEIVQK